MSSIDIEIFSENVNGIGSDSVRRQALFSKLKRKGCGAFMMQETHCTLALENTFKREFDSENIYFSNGSSSSCGVLTAFSKDYEIEVVNVIKDNEGRFLILDVIRKDHVFRLGNIYAPTRNFERDQIRVLKSFAEIIYDTLTENIITSGDWNLYMTKLDKLDSMPDSNDNPKYRRDLQSFLNTNDMIDPWRTLNPTKKMFTWHRGDKRSRLDYIFCSQHLLNVLKEVSILPGIQSDHSLLYININGGQENKRGKGFWKWNSDLVHDLDYVNGVKQLIQQKEIELSALEDLSAKWELIKLAIRNYTIPYCCRKKKLNMQREKDLDSEYLRLFNIVHTQEDVSDILMNQYNSVKSELENIEKIKSRGIILRSKVQWVEEGEKNTSYFLRLERANYKNKHIEQLMDNSNRSIITDPEKILNLQRDFYQKLFTDTNHNNDEADRELFESVELPKIPNIEKIKCEKQVSEYELTKSIKSMKNGRSPGTDGLTSEFYKLFYIDIKEILLSSINYELQTGKLSIEKRRGILTLIPKKEKNRLFLKNWRPLTLLNTDYKIIANIIASRIKGSLPIIINDDQTGYIKGRFIGTNIRLIEDIIVLTNQNKITGILLTIDFEKAFDSLRWSFILKALEAFGFGEKLRSYVKTMYSDISTTVINNGFTSSWFSPQKGVRQGCPLSPYLFIISVEILACYIRQSKDIRGIQIRDTEIKVSQLADDTSCFIKDERSLTYLLRAFKLYHKSSGLGINVDKTSARCLGGFVPSKPDLLDLKWTQEPVETLGVIVTGNENDHLELNFRPKIIKMKHLLSSWKCRKLSLKGKITVVNSLALSKLIYLCSIIHVPDKVYSEVKSIITDFIWDGKVAKIAYDTLIMGIDEGGLKLVDLKTKVKSLNASWIKRSTDSSFGKWKAIPRIFYKTNDLNFYFSCNHAPLKNVLPVKFYENIHNVWSEMCTVSALSKSVIINQTIWCNRYITIENKPFLWQRWKTVGINKIGDLMNGDQFLSPTELSNKFNIQINFLEVLQLRQSLPFTWRNTLHIKQTPELFHGMILYFVKGEVRSITKDDTKQVYKLLIENTKVTPNCIKKWGEIFPDISEELWKDIFNRTFRFSRETKLQSFQYRILHRTIPCRKKLFEQRIVDSKDCTVCGVVDNLQHFLFACDYVKQFWTMLKTWLYENLEYELELAVKNILFGLSGEGETITVLNYVVIHAKYYINTNRLNDNHRLSMPAFKAILRYNLEIERRIVHSKNPEKFHRFLPLLEKL